MVDAAPVNLGVVAAVVLLATVTGTMVVGTVEVLAGQALTVTVTTAGPLVGATMVELTLAVGVTGMMMVVTVGVLRGQFYVILAIGRLGLKRAGQAYGHGWWACVDGAQCGGVCGVGSWCSGGWYGDWVAVCGGGGGASWAVGDLWCT